MVFLWLGKWFMIFLWFQYGFEYGRENDLWFSYGFEYDFFMVLNMIFYGFEYDFLWFWIWFFYGFGRNLLQNQFLWWNQNRKKIVNATKVPRNCFLAKNSRNFRFFYDFGKVSLSQKLFSTTEIDFEADSYQNRKKFVNVTKVPRNSFLAKNSRNLRFW